MKLSHSVSPLQSWKKQQLRKKLQAAAIENPSWESYYLDYKALKQILGQLAPLDGVGPSEGDAQVGGGSWLCAVRSRPREGIFC